MNFIGKSWLRFISFFIVISGLFLPKNIFSQVKLQGRVIYEKDAMPAAAANIELQNEKGGTFTNNDGNFSIILKSIKNNDTLLISSVGYEKLKIPVSAAMSKKEYRLTEHVRNMESVSVFNTHKEIGSAVESVGYFRSWNTKNTGGEIGRVFNLPYKKYKIDKVRFKVANFCDTCMLRLHIRQFGVGIPGGDILEDSVSITINQMMLNGKTPEFDISEYDLTFSDKELFVSIEVLNCSTKPKESCSFSFAGTEKGAYLYKSTATSEWQTTDDYTLYLKLFLRY
jgi:hypothetical protein